MAAKETTPKKRRVSHKGAKAKGTRGEQEFCQIMTELGIPTQRVVASGAHKYSGAESDTKVGIIPNPDGSFPPADETAGIMRAECKNLASTPERYWSDLSNDDLTVVLATKAGQEAQWKHLKQSKSNKVVALRRAKVPQGAVAKKQYGEVFGVFMDVETFADLMRRAYPDRVFYAPQSSEPNSAEAV